MDKDKFHDRVVEDGAKQIALLEQILQSMRNIERLLTPPFNVISTNTNPQIIPWPAPISVPSVWTQCFSCGHPNHSGTACPILACICPENKESIKITFE